MPVQSYLAFHVVHHQLSTYMLLVVCICVSSHACLIHDELPCMSHHTCHIGTHLATGDIHRHRPSYRQEDMRQDMLPIPIAAVVVWHAGRLRDRRGTSGIARYSRRNASWSPPKGVTPATARRSRAVARRRRKNQKTQHHPTGGGDLVILRRAVRQH